MENTLENKAKFFAQYYGQQVLNYGLKELCFLNFAFMLDDDISKNILELKPLSLITNEDAIEIVNIDNLGIGYYSDDKSIRSVKSILKLPSLSSGKVDYLRSKGYALPWMGLNVETLQEYGWIKLKTD
jgi:hypothetical protein